MKMVGERFGKVVREARGAQGWSQEQLAGRADLNRSYLGEIERGSAMPSLATVVKLAGALGVSPSALLGRLEPPSEQRAES
jgi:transcriptional regulator with XRE-family HTH domain